MKSTYIMRLQLLVIETDYCWRKALLRWEPPRAGQLLNVARNRCLPASCLIDIMLAAAAAAATELELTLSHVVLRWRSDSSEWSIKFAHYCARSIPADSINDAWFFFLNELICCTILTYNVCAPRSSQLACYICVRMIFPQHVSLAVCIYLFYIYIHRMYYISAF